MLMLSLCILPVSNEFHCGMALVWGKTGLIDFQAQPLTILTPLRNGIGVQVCLLSG